MRPRPRSTPPVATVLTALALALAGVLGGSGSASAHDVLASTDPADRSTVGSLPAQVRLTFTAEVLSLGTVVQVSGPAGRVDTGRPRIDGGVVVQPLDDAGAPAGRYTIRWRATSSDGHPVSGTLSFTTSSATTPSSSSSSSSSSAGSADRSSSTAASSTGSTGQAPAAAGDTSGDGGSPATGPLLAAGVVVLVVAALALLVTRRRKAGGPPSA